MNPIDKSIVLIASTITPGSDAIQGSLGGLIVFVMVALGFSFLCSILEAVLLSSSFSHVGMLAQAGRRSGKLMQKHKQNVDQPISAILTLNTIAHTAGAAGAGAQAVAVFGSEFLGVISAILTLLILIFSEIIPKTLGAVYWKQLTPFAAYTIEILIIVLYPVVWMSKAFTRLITPEEKLPTVTRSELEMLAQISAVEGALEEKESRILKNLLHLDGVQVGDIMTPRTVVLAFQQDETIGEVIASNPVIPHSRIPVYGNNIDDIVGFALRYDLFKMVAEGQESMTLKELARPIHSVPETLTVARVLQEFMTRQQHIFLVLDEYSGTSGIITMEDAIESLLGAEITDESDLVADMRQLAEQRYLRQRLLLEATQQKTANDRN
jgi:CBS domain containing-hemolysin-like protein